MSEASSKALKIALLAICIVAITAVAFIILRQAEPSGEEIVTTVPSATTDSIPDASDREALTPSSEDTERPENGTEEISIEKNLSPEEVAKQSDTIFRAMTPPPLPRELRK
ncbi:MAG: hypothetical protein WAU28_01290 [Candidatus Moraniibacteriota bacterium]